MPCQGCRGPPYGDVAVDETMNHVLLPELYSTPESSWGPEPARVAFGSRETWLLCWRGDRPGENCLQRLRRTHWSIGDTSIGFADTARRDRVGACRQGCNICGSDCENRRFSSAERQRAGAASVEQSDKCDCAERVAPGSGRSNFTIIDATDVNTPVTCYGRGSGRTGSGRCREATVISRSSGEFRTPAALRSNSAFGPADNGAGGSTGCKCASPGSDRSTGLDPASAAAPAPARVIPRSEDGTYSDQAKGIANGPAGASAGANAPGGAAGAAASGAPRDGEREQRWHVGLWLSDANIGLAEATQSLRRLYPLSCSKKHP